MAEPSEPTATDAPPVTETPPVPPPAPPVKPDEGRSVGELVFDVSERWSLLLAASDALYEQDIPAREKLAGIARFIIDSYRHDPELMKVIIVEVTRAANSFGRTHLPEIRRAYDSIAAIVAKGQEDGTFRSDISSEFATLCFYGAIEQLLTGWIFEVIPASDTDFDQAKSLVVATICDGLEPR